VPSVSIRPFPELRRGDQSQPILIAPLVEEIRFVIKKVLDFLSGRPALTSRSGDLGGDDEDAVMDKDERVTRFLLKQVSGAGRGYLYRSALNSRLRGIDDGKPY
jgi:hypothetical protein